MRFRIDMKNTVLRLLLCLLRLRISRRLITWIFTNMSDVIPVKHLCETETLIAFHHPQPSYALHILLVPKRPYATFMDVPPEATDLMRDLFSTVQSLVRTFGLERGGYRLIANGGAYQDVPHLHFHLVADQVAND